MPSSISVRNICSANFSVNRYAKKCLKIPRGNQYPYIEEEQTTQWAKEIKDKSTTNDLQNKHIN
jgi:hypothetical protein